MAPAILLALLLASNAAAADAGRVGGAVRAEGSALPGCTVTMRAGALERVEITDANGEYSFDELPPGRYELTIELAGLRPVKRDVDVEGSARLPVETLEVIAEETIVIACGRLCDHEPPADAWDFPDCADYEMNDALIDSHRLGDGSASILLRSRHDAELTLSERHRIAGALLGTREDGDLWSELEVPAEAAVRFPQTDAGHSPEFLAWCDERGVDPEDQYWMMLRALGYAGSDRRSRPLLLRALETTDTNLIASAIGGLAEQGDLAALEAISAALDRVGDEAWSLALGLAFFQSPAADAVARRFFHDDEDGSAYVELRESSRP